DIQSAQPNYRFKLAQTAGVSQSAVDGFSQQYAPNKLHLPQAHRLSTGQGALVAVIDTGIDRLHPEIAGAIAGTFDAIGARRARRAPGRRARYARMAGPSARRPPRASSPSAPSRPRGPTPRRPP